MEDEFTQSNNPKSEDEEKSSKSLVVEKTANTKRSQKKIMKRPNTRSTKCKSAYFYE